MRTNDPLVGLADSDAQHPGLNLGQQGCERKRLLVDRSVQGILLRRFILYVLAGALYFLMTVVIGESLSNPGESITETVGRCLTDLIYWAPGIMLLLPVMIYDLARVTNRIAGPILRLRRELNRLAQGLPCEPLVLRQDDYWSDISVSFNRLRHEVLRLRCAPSESRCGRKLPASDESRMRASTSRAQ